MLPVFCCVQTNTTPSHLHYVCVQRCFSSPSWSRFFSSWGWCCPFRFTYVRKKLSCCRGRNSSFCSAAKLEIARGLVPRSTPPPAPIERGARPPFVTNASLCEGGGGGEASLHVDVTCRTKTSALWMVPRTSPTSAPRMVERSPPEGRVVTESCWCCRAVHAQAFWKCARKASRMLGHSAFAKMFRRSCIG